MAHAGIGHSVEGIHAVEAALVAGRVAKLIVEEGRLGRLSGLVQQATAAGVPIRKVRDIRDLTATQSPQGVLAECRAVATVSIDELASHDSPALVVIDHIQDPHNVGAIARSAAAAGMTGMVVADVRAAPVEATAFKTSAGALERLPVALVASIPQALKRLRDKGVWIVGLAAGAAESLFGMGLLTEPVAVVIGSEERGLSELTEKRCDLVASIPMAAGSESLNASVAAALACFEVQRARRI